MRLRPFDTIRSRMRCFFRRSVKLPKTHWGFPVVKSSLDDRKADLGERGVAMLIAILVSSMIIIFTSDMIINATVGLELAVASRDNIKAEYLAKSGVNLALFVIAADLGIDAETARLNQQELASTKKGDIWQALNGQQINAGTAAMAALFQKDFGLNSVNDSKIIEQIQVFNGSFTITIEDEAGKINLNYCSKGVGKPCIDMIEALLSCPVEKEFLDRRKLLPKQLAANIKDWVDFNKGVTEGSDYSGENDPYSDRSPAGGAKNAPFDSLEELKLVEGWDDDMYTIFSPYFTVYPVQRQATTQSDDKFRINHWTASRELLSCIRPDKDIDCHEKIALFHHKDSSENEGSGYQYIKEMTQTEYCQQSENMAKMLTYRSDTFRVLIEADSEDQKKRLEVVVHRQLPDAIDKKNSFKGSYKILHWKMI